MHWQSQMHWQPQIHWQPQTHFTLWSGYIFMSFPYLFWWLFVHDLIVVHHSKLQWFILWILISYRIWWVHDLKSLLIVTICLKKHAKTCNVFQTNIIVFMVWMCSCSLYFEQSFYLYTNLLFFNIIQWNDHYLHCLQTSDFTLQKKLARNFSDFELIVHLRWVQNKQVKHKARINHFDGILKQDSR
jgi:hypothetical protein